MYKIMRARGTVDSIIKMNEDGTQTSLWKGSRHWPEFLKWNDEQKPEDKLDLSDKEPEKAPEVPPDEVEFTPKERAALRALLKGLNE